MATRAAATKAAPKKAPAKKAAPAKAAPAAKEASTAKGSAWLKEHVNEKLGTSYESTKIRQVLRKLIADETIESPKEGRYEFKGVNDPNVKAVIAHLREEAKAGPKKAGRKPKAAPAEDPEEEEVEDLDLEDEDELEDLDDEE